MKQTLAKLAALTLTGGPPLDATAQVVSLTLYRALAEGRSVSVDDLASRGGMPDADVIAELLEGWPAVFRDDAGAVNAYWGLSLRGTNHRIRARGVDLTMWCAFDTLFIAELLDCQVEIVSPCPETGSEIRITTRPDGLVEVTPDDVVLSFLDPSDRVGDDVRSLFCHHIHFFAGRGAGERWVNDRPDSFLLSLPEGVELAGEANRCRYPAFFPGS